MNAVITNILSANGSANFPKFVTKCWPRAILPSAKSVNDATAKMTVATTWVTGMVVPAHTTCPQLRGNTIIRMKTGIRIIRNTVNLLGKFKVPASSATLFDGQGNRPNL